MSETDTKLARSLTAESVELIPHLPYLLQDLWELGSSPKDMVGLITKHISVTAQTRILDLACGKGAVSIALARHFGCRVKGIDLIPDFIEFAMEKAREYGVSNLCEFSVGDINRSVEREKDYEIVILGAVGDVLGTQKETIEKLRSTIRPGGFMLLDDAYGKEGSDTGYLSREEWTQLLEQARVRLIDEKGVDPEELKRLNQEQQRLIVMRAKELMIQYPDRATLFESYIRSQQAECNELETDITGVTMLLQAL